MTHRIPDRLRQLWTADVAKAAAMPFDDQPVFPSDIVIDRVGEPDRLFPGWPTDVVVISHENQGVCSWGVPLDADDDPPVLVGGDVQGGRATIEHVPSISAFIDLRAWDRACMDRAPLIQAQADPVDEATLDYLRTRFQHGPTSAGWPADTQLRFGRGDARILLWSGADQCDWWISGPLPILRDVVHELAPLSNLRRALWSNDARGERLLTELGVPGPWR